jgi:hypothetical protein
VVVEVVDEVLVGFFFKLDNFLEVGFIGLVGENIV